MKHLILATLLALQVSSTAEIDLDREERRTRSSYSMLIAVTIIAQSADGPVNKGWISCDGNWWKHGDGDKDGPGKSIPQHWFRTDARGAIIMNPSVNDLDDDGTVTLRCRAADRSMKVGESHTFVTVDGGVVTLPY